MEVNVCNVQNASITQSIFSLLRLARLPTKDGVLNDAPTATTDSI